MEPQAAAVVVLLVVMGTALIIKIQFEHLDDLEAHAYEKYNRAHAQLKRWKIARPFLRIAECSYSRMLVYEMIDAYTQLLSLGVLNDAEHLAYLYGLLDDRSPPYSPIISDSAPTESFFCYDILLVPLRASLCFCTGIFTSW